MNELPHDINTMMPCTITAFDPQKQTVSVQLTIKSKFYDNTQPITQLTDVPLWTMSSNGFAITLPIKPPCAAMVLFAQRSIDQWYTSGGVVDPLDNRTHHLSDAICIAGLRAAPQAIGEYDADAVVIRTEDNSTTIALKPDDIKVTAKKVAIESEQTTINGTEVAINTDHLRIGNSTELMGVLTQLFSLLASDKAMVLSGSSTGEWDLRHKNEYASLGAQLQGISFE